MGWVELHRMLNSGTFLTHHHCMMVALAIDPESIMGWPCTWKELILYKATVLLMFYINCEIAPMAKQCYGAKQQPP